MEWLHVKKPSSAALIVTCAVFPLVPFYLVNFNVTVPVKVFPKNVFIFLFLKYSNCSA